MDAQHSIIRTDYSLFAYYNDVLEGFGTHEHVITMKLTQEIAYYMVRLQIGGSAMEGQMDKATLLDNISAGHEMLVKVLSPLDETQMTAVGVSGDWSIKDILAHLTAWQKCLLTDMQDAKSGDEPATSALNITGEEMDRLNEQFYQGNKAQPLNEVLTDFHSTHSQLLATVQAMSEEDLSDSDRFAWTDGKPLWQFVASETYEHSLEHIGAIRRWLARDR